jgi:pimeloyl-ACP methyl ester carboxylesterase
MTTITTRDGVAIYYKDWGPKDAQPIVFHHGWPLSSDDWDTQLLFFVGQGYRVVAHDRRGHAGLLSCGSLRSRWCRLRAFAFRQSHTAPWVR